jgi:peptidoglycan/xylan/chitin deacetylase (PgdA/CDA1 family)
MYHRVVAQRPSPSLHWTIGADDFRRQMALIDRWGFTPITFRDYRCFLDGLLDLPRKPIVITFDDGYLDTFQVAYPILREFGFKAVVFVLALKQLRTNFWDRGSDIHEAPLLTEDHILELHEAGMEIGSHSLTHSRLTKISEEALQQEVSRSRILLELLLDAPVQSFSYPYGLVNERVKNAVRNAGYRLACSAGSGPPVFGTDPLEVRRLTITGGMSKFGFAIRMLTPFTYVDWVRHEAGKILHREKEPVITEAASSKKIREQMPVS